jgi:cobalamin biosynthesis protein CobT
MVERLGKAGFELVGIGIQDDSVKYYYPKNFVIQNVQELPGLVMNELRRILSA